MSSEPGPRFTTTQWLVCIIAAIGFLFDTYELLMLPLVANVPLAVTCISSVTYW